MKSTTSLCVWDARKASRCFWLTSFFVGSWAAVLAKVVEVVIVAVLNLFLEDTIQLKGGTCSVQAERFSGAEMSVNDAALCKAEIAFLPETISKVFRV